MDMEFPKPCSQAFKKQAEDMGVSGKESKRWTFWWSSMEVVAGTFAACFWFIGLTTLETMCWSQTLRTAVTTM